MEAGTKRRGWLGSFCRDESRHRRGGLEHLWGWRQREMTFDFKRRGCLGYFVGMRVAIGKKG